MTSCTLSLAHGAVPRDTFLDILAVFTSSKYCVNVLRWMHLSSSCLFAYLPSALKGQDGKPNFGAFFACLRALLHRNQDIHFLSAVITGLQDAPWCGLIPNKVFLSYIACFSFLDPKSDSFPTIPPDFKGHISDLCG